MAGLDFFVDVVVSGAVLGVGLTDSPDEVARTLVETSRRTGAAP